MHGGTTNDILIMLSSPNCHVRQERKMIMSEYKPKKSSLIWNEVRTENTTFFYQRTTRGCE
jgi:hypothetical protein